MDKRITMVGMICLLVVALAIVVNILFGKPASFHGTAYTEPYPPAPEFSLTDSKGKVINLRDLRGKVVLLFFGYTYCPDICPTTLAELKLATKDLGKEADQVQVMFISVDPRRDTSESMQSYVDRFDPGFYGLSGTEEQLSPIWTEYGIFREIVEGSSENNYIVNHTGRIILIDQDGNLRLSYGIQVDPEDVSQDIQILFKAMSMFKNPFVKRMALSMVAGLVIGLILSEVTFLFLGQTARPPKTITVVVPAGTAELVARGEQPPSLPQDMTFVTGDVLIIDNQDSVDHQLGPLWIPAGTSGQLVLGEPENLAMECSFQANKYIGLDIHDPLTLYTRIYGILFAGLPMGILIAVYAAIIPPRKDKRDEFSENVQP